MNFEVVNIIAIILGCVVVGYGVVISFASKPKAQESITVQHSVTDQDMDKLNGITNEKMMAINEYSEFVIQEIDKKHKELLFLYQMLNDKEKRLKEEFVSIQKFKEPSEPIVANIIEYEKPLSYETAEVRNEEKTVIEVSEDIKEAIEITETIHSAPQPDIPKDNLVILELYHEGYPIQEIAKELSLGVGEVKLIIDLYKRGEQ